MENKMPKHICFLKDEKIKKRYQLALFSKRENGKSKLLFCKRYDNLEEAVAGRDQWLAENDPEKLKRVKAKEGGEIEKV